MDEIMLAISGLLATTTFLLIIAIYQLITQRFLSGQMGVRRIKPRAWLARFQAFLSLVPIPPKLVNRWGDQRISLRLIHAGIALGGREYAVFRWVILWLAGCVALIFGSVNGWDALGLFLGLLTILIVYFGPVVWLEWRCQVRSDQINLTLPNFIDRLTLSMEAGLGFEIALRRTSKSFPGLLGNELRLLVRAIDHGHLRSEALDQLIERAPSNDLAAFVTAVKQSDRLGTSLAKVLRTQSQLLRKRRRRRAEEAGRRLPILVVFPLVFFFLPALLIIYLAPPLLHLFLGR